MPPTSPSKSSSNSSTSAQRWARQRRDPRRVKTNCACTHRAQLKCRTIFPPQLTHCIIIPHLYSSLPIFPNRRRAGERAFDVSRVVARLVGSEMQQKLDMDACRQHQQQQQQQQHLANGHTVKANYLHLVLWMMAKISSVCLGGNVLLMGNSLLFQSNRSFKLLDHATYQMDLGVYTKNLSRVRERYK